MMFRKIALYVEGQTEQILINHFIKTWWDYSNIRIQNLKLRADGSVPCKISNFPSKDVEDPDFLIIDVEGVGSLSSIIAGRANRQHDLGFRIIGLRDADCESLSKDQMDVLIQKTIEKFRQSLNILGCKNSEKIDLFFAIMEIDAWLLAFTTALSKWSSLSEDEVLEIINAYFKNVNISGLEQIPYPAGLREKIGRQRSSKDPKSYASLMSLITPISREEIQTIYTSQRIPSFNKFWSALIN